MVIRLKSIGLDQRSWKLAEKLLLQSACKSKYSQNLVRFSSNQNESSSKSSRNSSSNNQINKDSSWPKMTVSAINSITTLFDVMTYPIYYVLQRPWIRKQFSNRIKALPVSKDNKQITYRSVERPGEVHVRLVEKNIATLDKTLALATKIHANKKCLGTRKILSEENEVQPNGQVFKKYQMGEYEWQTFSDVQNAAEHFGRGLRALGHKAYRNTVVFAETRAEWIISAFGCFKQNFPIVTIYATLGDEGVIHGISETESTIVITSHDLLPKFKKLLHSLPKVRVIIYMEDQLHPTETDGFKEGVRILSHKNVIEMGKTSSAVASPPKPEDVAIIMYTSGSTGTPKGVLLTHRNVVTTLKGFSDRVPIYPNDVLLGLLPLAHVFELLSECLCLSVGVPIGYSTPLTLTDLSSKIKQGGQGDISILRPTTMSSVPLILDRISKEIQSNINSSTPMQQALFRFAFDYKKKWVQKGFRTPILDQIIFEKIRKTLGGRVRAICSGGAPLSSKTQNFLQLCMMTDILQGYGLTETTAGGTATDQGDMSVGHVGSPLTSCDIRLVDWDEGGYRITNKPYPQGEILIGGDVVGIGYYKLPEKTAKDFITEDGQRWFKSGDIGEFHEDGVLKIIDRKQDLVKLQAGEYVSLGKIETVLKTCAVVDDVCVCANPTKQRTIALIVPNPNNLSKIARAKGISGKLDDLCSSPVVIKEVTKKITNYANKCNLHKFEMPAAVILCKEVWTPESGLVTAALKLKRKEIQNKYKEDIERMYASMK